jgi:hypothetical protein
MMRRGLLVLLLLSLGLNAGLLWSRWNAGRDPGSAAWSPPFEGGPRHAEGRGWAHRRSEALGRRLPLDEARRRELDAALSPLEPDLTAARLSLRQARRALGAALHEKALDRDRILTLQREVSQRQAILDSLVTEALLREAAVLRPEERMRSGRWFPRGRGER